MVTDEERICVTYLDMVRVKMFLLWSLVTVAKGNNQTGMTVASTLGDSSLNCGYLHTILDFLHLAAYRPRSAGFLCLRMALKLLHC